MGTGDAVRRLHNGAHSASARTDLGPPLVGLVAYGLLMSLPVGVDVRADVRDLGAILETRGDGVEEGVACGVDWL